MRASVKATHKGFRIPGGSQYDRTMDTYIRRISQFEMSGDMLIAKRRYAIDGRRYIVNSIYDTAHSPKCEEALKRLMAKELEKSA